jgi:hypothetical protein
MGLSIIKLHKITMAVLLVCLIAISTGDLFSQQIRADVELILERLPMEKQEKLKNFDGEIEAYLNDYDWTGGENDIEIPVTIQIYLQDKSVSYENRYGGTFLISNNSDIQYYDKYWYFPYDPSKPLFHNEGVFEPFASFLDYYIYLILGGEYDKYGKLLGTPFYERAKQISNQAKFNTTFMKGWDEREVLIDRILGKEFALFRQMKDIYFLGRSYIGEEDTTVVKYCVEAIDLLDRVLDRDPENKEAQQFVKAHHIEFIEMFQDDPRMLRKLIRIDPEHEETYRQYLKD